MPKWQSGQVKNELAGPQRPWFVPVRPLLSVKKLKPKLNLTVTVTKIAALPVPLYMVPHSPSLTAHLYSASSTLSLVCVVITLPGDGHFLWGFQCVLPRKLWRSYTLASAVSGSLSPSGISQSIELRTAP